MQPTSNTDPRIAPASAAASAGLIPGLLLSAFVILACLVAGELILRHWFPLGGVVFQPDARYLFKYIPNSRKVVEARPGNGESNLVAINSQGRRGEVVQNRRPRVVVYGDSFIAGEMTRLSRTFAARLEQQLGARLSAPVQVINAGVPAYGPDQECLVMEDEIGTLQPDLVILAIYSGNDYGDLVRNKLYRLDDRQQLVAGHPTLDQWLIDYFAQSRRQSPFQIVRRANSARDTLRSSRFGRKARRLLHVGRTESPAPSAPPMSGSDYLRRWLGERQDEYRNSLVRDDNHVHNLFADTFDADVSLTPLSPSAQYKKILMERVMERIQSVASSHSVPVIFLFIPTAIDVEDGWDISVDAGRYPEYRRTQLTGVLEQIAKDHRLAYLNLFEPFREHRSEHLYYRSGDDHWNIAGQQLAASLMTEYIMRAGLFHANAAR